MQLARTFQQHPGHRLEALPCGLHSLAGSSHRLSLALAQIAHLRAQYVAAAAPG